MGLSTKKRRYVTFFAALLFGAAFAFVLFLPYPKNIGLRTDTYTVHWSDGSRTEESFADALSCVIGVTEDGEILLQRGALFGTYVGENYLKEAVRILEEGELAPMLAMDFPFNRLESAALFRAYGDRLCFDTGEWLRFNGEKVVLTEIGRAGTVFFTGGTLSASLLIPTGAERLILGDLAEFSYQTVYGTSVRIEGKSRYIVENGAVIDTSLGKIFAAGEPLATDIVVPDVTVAAQGALLPARELVSVSLPFVGSGPVAAGERFYGELGYLFSEGEEYFVPATLKRVRVRGGALISFAFYHCPDLEEIDACGVDPLDIESEAFEGLPSLRYLHTPRADVKLTDSEKFTTYVAECGCTIYERKEVTDEKFL